MANDDDSMVTWTRPVILLMAGLGASAAALGTNHMRLFVLLFFIPSVSVYVKPTWGRLAVWCVWGGLLATAARLFGSASHLGDDVAVGMMMTAATMLFVALPAIRMIHERLPRTRLPKARIHRRD